MSVLEPEDAEERKHQKTCIDDHKGEDNIAHLGLEDVR